MNRANSCNGSTINIDIGIIIRPSLDKFPMDLKTRNLAIENKSRVSCAVNTSSADIQAYSNYVTLKSGLKVTEGHLNGTI